MPPSRHGWLEGRQLPSSRLVTSRQRYPGEVMSWMSLGMLLWHSGRSILVLISKNRQQVGDRFLAIRHMNPSTRKARFVNDWYLVKNTLLTWRERVNWRSGVHLGAWCGTSMTKQDIETVEWMRWDVGSSIQALGGSLFIVPALPRRG